MQKEKRRPAQTVKVLTVKNWDQETLEALADAPESESMGLTRNGDQVAFIGGDFKTFVEQSFGGPLQQNEHWGEGIPYECSCPQTAPEWCPVHGIVGASDHQAFELRTLRREGYIELQFASEGLGRHSIFHIKSDLSETDLFEIQNRFQLLSARFLGESARALLYACCGMQSDDPSVRGTVYSEIIQEMENRFKALLKWDRYTEVESLDDGLVNRSVRIPIERGRNPTHASALEAEEQKFKERVFAAMSKLEAEGRKITQVNVGEVMFGGHGDPQSLIRNRLKNFRLAWKTLRREYESKKVVKNCP